MLKLWCYFEEKIDLAMALPAVSLLVLWLCGALGFYAFSIGSYWLIVPAIAAVVFTLKNWKSAFAILGGVLMIWLATSRRDAVLARELPTGIVNGVLQITDLSIVPKQYVYARKKYAAEVTVDANSYNVLVDFREVPNTIAYGKIYQVSGRFKKPGRGDFPGDFDYAGFLAERGVVGLFKVNKAVDEGRGGWKLFDYTERLRAMFLQKATAGFSLRGEYCRFLVGILLGNKDSVTPREKEAFVSSGLFHLFAVSGLHVAILSVILSLLLRACAINVRCRCFLMPFLLLIYVFISGSSPSAVRAWAMISTWSLARGIFRAVNLYNTLAASALALLVYRPLYICNPGFQLSFLIVFFLIRAFSHKKELYQVLCARSLLVPPEYGRVRKTLYLCCYDTFYIGISVFLAALGLQAFYFGIFQPLSILSAAWSGTCAFGVLISACAKCFLPAFLLNPLIVFFLDPLLLFAEFVQEKGLFIKVLTVLPAVVFAYYVGLTLLTASGRYAFKFGVATVVGSIILIMCPRMETSWQVAVVSSGGKINSVIAWNEAVATSVVWLGEKNAQNSVIRLLKSRNIEDITLLCRKNVSVDNCYLLDRFHVENEAIVPEKQWSHAGTSFPAFKIGDEGLGIRLLGYKNTVPADYFAKDFIMFIFPSNN